jgi:DNA-directed RNA polymerase specialized sigma24 family protein
MDDLPDEAVVPWFYRVLRNAVIDDYRRRRQPAPAALVGLWPFGRETLLPD